MQKTSSDTISARKIEKRATQITDIAKSLAHYALHTWDPIEIKKIWKKLLRWQYADEHMQRVYWDDYNELDSIRIDVWVKESIDLFTALVDAKDPEWYYYLWEAAFVNWNNDKWRGFLMKYAENIERNPNDLSRYLEAADMLFRHWFEEESAQVIRSIWKKVEKWSHLWNWAFLTYFDSTKRKIWDRLWPDKVLHY